MILVDNATGKVILSAPEITLNADHAEAGGVSYYGGISQATHTLHESERIPYGQANWWTYNAGNFAMTSVGLAVIAEKKREEIQAAAEDERNAGFSSSALGTPHGYGSTLEDRINLIGASQAGQPTKYNATENGKRVRKQHTPAQMQTVLADGFAAIQAINDKEAGLLDQIDAAATQAELDTISWWFSVAN